MASRAHGLALLVLMLLSSGPVAPSPPTTPVHAAGRAPALDPEPPPLPVPADGCVGPSPVVFATVPWPLARLAPQRVWPLTKGAGQLVAIVDSGVSGGAPTLAGAVRAGTDVVSGGPADSDCAGRGTALAGIVAGRPATGTGVVGIAPAASVLPIRIIDQSGRIPPDALALGIQAAAAAGADVILVATGTPNDSADLRAAVGAAVAGDAVVVAAINTNPPTPGERAEVWYPAAYEAVLAVGGVDADGVPMQVSPPAAGLDLLAPAVGAVAPGPVGTGHYVVGGAGVAAAYVAGAVALVQTYHPELRAAQIRERLQLTAEFGAGGGSVATVDPYAAVIAIDPYRATASIAPRVESVVLPAPPPVDPALGRAGRVAAVTATAALAFLAIAATLRRRRHRG